MGDRNNLTVAGGGVLGGQIAWHSAYSGKNVDVADASYLNTIDDAELRAACIDPDFNPEHRAFLLRARAGNSNTYLAGVRLKGLQRRYARHHSDEGPGSSLHVTDLLHALSHGKGPGSLPQFLEKEKSR